MAQHTAIGVYGGLSEAEAAVRSLGGGFPFALLGGTESGVVGPMTGVVGWLYHVGLQKEHVEKYEQAIKAGKFILIVHGSKDTAAAGRDALAKSGAERLDLHALSTA
jgi:hypothetical protein